MPLELYYHGASPPCRSVLMTARVLGLSLTLKEVDMLAGQHLKPEFVAINPQHTIPTMVDGSIKLWESRAICTYLATQYGKDDTLYPNNPKARCLVDARLYFDMGTLHQRWAEYAYPVFSGAKPDEAKLPKMQEALGWLNIFLQDYAFAAGNKLTVADICLVATVSTMEAAGIDLDSYTRIQRWLKKCKSLLPGYDEANGEGAKIIGDILKSKLKPE